MNLMSHVTEQYSRKDVPDFRPGDLVRVHVKIKEGDKERVQIFEGNVIGIKGGQTNETFTVRKVSNGIGVERIFPIHAPTVANIEIVNFSKVRRAKLYYLRDLRGRAARIRSRRSRKGSV